MLRHNAEKKNPERFALIGQGANYYKTDGLSDLKLVILLLAIVFCPFKLIMLFFQVFG